jgi:hypothetical protein
VGNITADLTDHGLSQSTKRVTHTKAAAERNLAQRAELIRNAIIEVCESQRIGLAPTLGADLQGVFDEIYEAQLPGVRDYVERTVPADAKRHCPIGELRPEINMYREELAIFAERLPAIDYWANIVLWFRSRRWSVPFVAIVVCLPLLFQWVEMLKTLLRWMGAIGEGDQ